MGGFRGACPIYAQHLKLMIDVGGREKPCRPLLKTIVTGALAARYDPSRPAVKITDNISLVVDDRSSVSAMRFGRQKHPHFPFTDLMPIRNACSLINVNPAQLLRALASQLKE